jgi:hypothetical protein
MSDLGKAEWLIIGGLDGVIRALCAHSVGLAKSDGGSAFSSFAGQVPIRESEGTPSSDSRSSLLFLFSAAGSTQPSSRLLRVACLV